jgi:Uma2 family endonuclease
MRTLVPDPPPPEIEAWLEQRRRCGADLHDEVWDGVLHVAPPAHGRHAELQAQLIAILDPLARERGLTPLAAFNLGSADDFRVPDAGLQRTHLSSLYYPTAALVLEVLSPGDESWEKLPFYAAHGVEELLIVDPNARAIHWLALTDDQYLPLAHSTLLDLGPGELAKRIAWPALHG